MMFLICLATMGFLGGSAPMEWAQCPKNSLLLYREEQVGCGYYADGEVTLLTEDGAVEKVVTAPNGTKPLYLSEEFGLVFAPVGLLRTYTAKEGFGDYWGYEPRVFAQGSALFVASSGVLLSHGRESLLFKDYGPWSAVGISADHRRVAHITTPFNSTSLRIATWTEDTWVTREVPASPGIRKVGLCGVLPRYNDVVFLDEDTVAFIGAFCAPVDSDAYTAWSGEVLDLTRYPLDGPSEKMGDCFLFVTRLQSGWTEAYCKLAYKATGEMGGPRENNLTTSKDNRYLYLRAYDKILRLETQDIIKRAFGDSELQVPRRP